MLRYACIALLALLAACASDRPTRSGSYVVKRGDTLYSIAFRHGLDYREVARLNGIGRDYAIHPGQVLRLDARAKASASAPKPNTPRPVARPTPPNAPPVQWVWPVQSGKTTLTTRPNGGQGFSIAGALGQDVKAAGIGRVVYTGTGLLGYGQLVIIKHNDAYLSAYGHTQTVLVREGQDVRGGQSIATMGAGPNGSPLLYFEIRLHGEPVDPTGYLPRGP
ncbi:MAG TPA: peptidoglycan DD-metalloendopeptidase family protein [Steroidobacteraceae bacterium]|nr:peptidoglycan DD-metalloendopeptidase family protein [Steroidobacteraceae bacterium]